MTHANEHNAPLYSGRGLRRGDVQCVVYSDSILSSHGGHSLAATLGNSALRMHTASIASSRVTRVSHVKSHTSSPTLVSSLMTRHA